METHPTGMDCPVCSYPMTRRVRARAQAHLPAEFVCWNMDCLDFGLYRHAAPRTVPTGTTEVRA
ncbi:MAG: hypothetical protein AVDCRST_MAG47-1383 [uncultured Nocardioidaceae bacterium]|uniref:Uncharacterized protein n=1 Tax=uncultured Nocardioidaceae bacterium TaxID=253824 RepID=A0A6J4MYV1_9ACTN|nr:MAG: hypothetical protein AVDCRST_MAG47-1383 [uncultured Nocardioidaceae bacterium]